MTHQDILERIQNVLYQGVDTESQDLDLLRHDLELHIINSSIDTDVSAEVDWARRREDKIKEQFNSECD